MSCCLPVTARLDLPGAHLLACHARPPGRQRGARGGFQAGGRRFPEPGPDAALCVQGSPALLGPPVGRPVRGPRRPRSQHWASGPGRPTGLELRRFLEDPVRPPPLGWQKLLYSSSREAVGGSALLRTRGRGRSRASEASPPEDVLQADGQEHPLGLGGLAPRPRLGVRIRPGESHARLTPGAAPRLGRAGSRASPALAPGLRLQWGVPTPSPDTQTSCRRHAAHAARCSHAQLSTHPSSCDSFVCKPASAESLFINPLRAVIEV